MMLSRSGGWEDHSSMCNQVLSLFGGFLVPWLQLPLCFLAKIGGCVLPLRNFSLYLITAATGVFRHTALLSILTLHLEMEIR